MKKKKPVFSPSFSFFFFLIFFYLIYKDIFCVIEKNLGLFLYFVGIGRGIGLFLVV
jgi:hypothetical protein